MCYEAIDYIRPDDSTDSGSDGSDSDSDSSSSSSGSDSNSSSGVEDCNLCKQSPKKVTSAVTKWSLDESPISVLFQVLTV